MQTVLLNFNNEILELRQHIKYVKNISMEIGSANNLSPYVNSLTKRKFNYKSLIISLYGIVENYSEKFIVKYLEVLSSLIFEYSNLKEVIKDKNIYNSANLTLRVLEQRHVKYNHLKAADLITNLSSCLNGQPNYLINFDAFTMLAGNLKHSKMCDLFKQIDIDLNSAFSKYTDFNLSNSENQFKKLDELVEMRNDVAHGNVVTLLDPSQIEEYVDFIEKYFTNLSRVLLSDLEQEKLRYWKNNHSIELQNVRIFNGNIVGFNNLENISIACDSAIIIERSDNSYQIASILNIQRFPNNDVTLKLLPETHLRENQRFFIKLP